MHIKPPCRLDLLQPHCHRELHINKAVAADEFVLSGGSSGKSEAHAGVDDKIVHKGVFKAAADHKRLLGDIVDDVVRPQ